jgi:hypothetical protein
MEEMISVERFEHMECRLPPGSVQQVRAQVNPVRDSQLTMAIESYILHQSVNKIIIESPACKGEVGRHRDTMQQAAELDVTVGWTEDFLAYRTGRKPAI